jgi:hypothetical protein
MSMLCWRVFGESWVGRERWNAWLHFELLKQSLPPWPPFGIGHPERDRGRLGS